MTLKSVSDARPIDEGIVDGVGGRGDCGKVYLVRGDEAVSSADLGGSSKYWIQ